MNEFLKDFYFKQYSMALKFDLLIQRYAILIAEMAMALVRKILVLSMTLLKFIYHP
jgi:hypothetical protein